ncbi:MAG: hypothetical protein KTR33_06340 [Gammaproteobacteria bacterium]|nr:hypothetical protein [Gammaproteobacteria bacterium]
MSKRRRYLSGLNFNRITVLSRYALFLLLTVCSFSAAATETDRSDIGQPAITQKPSQTILHPVRTFGYRIGDIIEQKALLGTPGQQPSAEPAIPLARIGNWLERQAVNTETRSDGNWLTITYQVINTPTAVIDTEIPALDIALNDGKTLSIPAWSFSLGPLTPITSGDTGDFPLLQPDRPPLVADKSGLTSSLRYLVPALALTLLIWLLWWVWRRHHDQVRLPFAYALHRLGTLNKAELSADPEAWVTVHNALNQQAGKVVQLSSVAEFLEESPWLKPMQSKIEQFFKASQARFFEQPSRTESFALQEFCRDLYSAEKRHAQ